jgi:branched-chain amino acid transport system substrate-binding protein
MFYGLLQAAKTDGHTTFATLYCAELPTCALSQGIFEGAGAVLGGINLKFAEVSLSSPDYTATCLSMKNQGVDVINAALLASGVDKVIQDCSVQGYKPEYYNVANNTASTTLLTNPLSEGMILVSPNANYLDNSIPAVKQFSDSLDAYDKGIRGGAAFTYDAMAAWAGGKLFEAAAKAGQLTPAATSADVKKGLYALKDETLGGLAPALNFREGQPAFTGCYFLMTVHDKSFVSLGGGKQYCVNETQSAALAQVPNG